MPNFELTLTEKQAQIISEALDMFSRVLGEQFDDVFFKYTKHNGKIHDRDAVERGLNMLYWGLTGHLRNTNTRGIYDPELPDEARDAYDLYQVIRHAIAWHKNPEGGMTVNFDQPTPTSMEPLARIKTINNEEKET